MHTITQLDKEVAEDGAMEGIHFDVMGGTEMAMLDQMLAEQDGMETRQNAQQEYERHEAFASRDAEQAGQWLDEQDTMSTT